MSNPRKVIDFEAYRQLVQDTLQRLKLDKRTPQELYAPIQYTLVQAEAKRIRPVLALLVQEFLRPDDPLLASPAVALEIFHNFTLLHDDVMDNSYVRRGKPSVFAEYGLTSAILSGDAMLVLAYEMLAEEVSPQQLSKLLSAFNEMAKQIMEGQQLDLGYELLDYISKDQYLQMIGYKTAVLIATATLFGAILSQANDLDLQCCYQLGWSLGIAFQLQDDYLDLYGDSVIFGKPLGGDILEGKKTILHTLAYATASVEQKRILTEAMKSADLLPEDKISTIRSIYDQLEVASQVQRLIQYYLEQAYTALDDLEMRYNRTAVQLRAFVDKLAKRNT